MGIKVNLEQLEAQAESVNSACQNLASQLETVTTRLSDFSSQDDLKGQAASSAKEFVTSYVIPMQASFLTVIQQVSTAVQKLPEDYRSQVDSKSWSEDELREKIQQIDTMIQHLHDQQDKLSKVAKKDKNKKASAKAAVQALHNKEKVYLRKKERFEEILEHLLEFNSTSNNVFNNINMNNFNTAVNSISNAYNGEKHSFPKEVPDWAEDAIMNFQKTINETPIGKGITAMDESSKTVCKIIEDTTIGNGKFKKKDVKKKVNEELKNKKIKHEENIKELEKKKNKVKNSSKPKDRSKRRQKSFNRQKDTKLKQLNKEIEFNREQIKAVDKTRDIYNRVKPLNSLSHVVSKGSNMASYGASYLKNRKDGDSIGKAVAKTATSKAISKGAGAVASKGTSMIVGAAVGAISGPLAPLTAPLAGAVAGAIVGSVVEDFTEKQVDKALDKV